LWAVACIFAGLTSAFLIILSYLVIANEVKWKDLEEIDQSRSRASTDNSQIGLVDLRVPIKQSFCLKKCIHSYLAVIKVIFVFCSLLIITAIFTMEVLRLLSYIGENNKNNDLLKLIDDSNTTFEGFYLLDTSKMWLMKIPAASIFFTSLLYAVISTIVLVISNNPENKISNKLDKLLTCYKKARLFQTVGSWLIVIGPLLQVLLQSCVKSCPNVDFNHNAVYHLVVAVASVLIGGAAVYMQVLSTKICKLRLVHCKAKIVECLYYHDTFGVV